MKISILTVGSRGDVQPYVALGQGLRAAGHDVNLATHTSARIRIQGERGQRVATTGPYTHIRHPNYAGGSLMGLASGLVFGSWPSIVPMLAWIGLLRLSHAQRGEGPLH